VCRAAGFWGYDMKKTTARDCSEWAFEDSTKGGNLIINNLNFGHLVED
jgi:hypothetical protein